MRPSDPLVPTADLQQTYHLIQPPFFIPNAHCSRSFCFRFLIKFLLVSQGFKDTKQALLVFSLHCKCCEVFLIQVDLGESAEWTTGPCTVVLYCCIRLVRLKDTVSLSQLQQEEKAQPECKKMKEKHKSLG